MWKILTLSVNILTADEKYCLLNRDNLTQSIHMQLSEKEKTFSGMFFGLFKSKLNFEHFQKAMTVIADVFPK